MISHSFSAGHVYDVLEGLRLSTRGEGNSVPFSRSYIKLVHVVNWGVRTHIQFIDAEVVMDEACGNFVDDISLVEN